MGSADRHDRQRLVRDRPGRDSLPRRLASPSAVDARVVSRFRKGVHQFLGRRRFVYPWVAWLVQRGAAPGDVLVFTDDDTDKTIDLLIACHLAGCGYSVCDTADEISVRTNAITEHGDGILVTVVDVAATQLAVVGHDELRKVVDERVTQVTHDALLATKTAYIMPTSGTTGQPKLVRISHGSLAVFCDAISRAYGWGAHDTVLQCAPLTSDISVEEIFGGAACGARLVRSAAMKTGDLAALVDDLVARETTIVDLPTAVWQLLCADGDAIDAIGRSRLRQIVIGGEAIRCSAVDKWLESAASQGISLLSSYGPTEATVVATFLPIVCDQTTMDGALLRLGRPILPNTVFLAFGEVVIVGDLVADGYLGIDGDGFGTVTAADGSRRRAFATGDRVTVDAEGFPVFSGRKDAVVKISGKRVDIAEVTRRIAEDPAVSDVAVELHSGSLGVWFKSQRTREGEQDAAAATRIRLVLVSLGVSSFSLSACRISRGSPTGRSTATTCRGCLSGQLLG